jgi:methylmalonyl-CoA mutase
MARNQLLILKEEALLDKVFNAADGAYYIERITQQLAEQALKLFKDIEAGGGFLQQLRDGAIQKKIRESAHREQQLFNRKEIILVGTNAYQNEKVKMESELQLYPFLKTNTRKTVIEPILEKRLAEEVEQKRLKDE